MDESINIFTMLENTLLALSNLLVLIVISGWLANTLTSRRQSFLGLIGVGLLGTTVALGLIYALLTFVDPLAEWMAGQPFWVGLLLRLVLSVIMTTLILALTKPNTIPVQRRRKRR